MWVGSLVAAAAEPWAVTALTEPGDPRPLGLLDVDADGDLDEVAFAAGRVVAYDGAGGAVDTLAAVAGTGVPLWQDLTGDGRPDLLFDDHLLAQGPEGWWTVALSLDPTAARAPLAAVDLDADGLPEVLRVGTDGLWAAGNDGGGAFRPFVRVLALPVGGARWTLAPGDLDGDGDLDLLRLDLTRLDWLRNDGWTWVEAPRIASSPLDARPIDWDGDGDLDVVGQTAFALPLGTWVAENDGAGTFGAPRSVGRVLDRLLAGGDVDGDGRADLLYGPGSGLTLARQDAAGQLGAPAPLTTPRGRPLAVWLADADGDGDRDLTVTDPAGRASAENDGAGGFTTTGRSGIPPCGVDAYGLSAPLGRTIPIQRSGGPPSLALPACRHALVPDGAGGFSPGPLATELAAPLVVDVDQDGLDDWVGLLDDALVWQRDDGGTLRPPAPLRFPARSLLHVVAGDAEGDGDADLLVTWFEAQDSGASEGTNVAAWLVLPERVVVPAWRVPDAAVSAAPVAADLDGDGDADVAVWGADGVTRIRENAGDGTLAARTTVDGRVTGSVDLDRDGWGDLFGQGPDEDGVFWRATGAFTFGDPDRTGPRAQAPTLVGDADHDGAPELWIPLDGQTVARAWGGAGLGPEVPFVQGTGDLAADLDGDGDTDLAGGGLVWWNPSAAPLADTADTRLGPAHSAPDPGEPRPSTASRPRSEPAARACGCTSGPGGSAWLLLLPAACRARRQRGAPYHRSSADVGTPRRNAVGNRFIATSDRSGRAS
jgi:hypothetical protein